jgi:hypothetical protein
MTRFSSIWALRIPTRLWPHCRDAWRSATACGLLLTIVGCSTSSSDSATSATGVISRVGSPVASSNPGTSSGTTSGSSGTGASPGPSAGGSASTTPPASPPAVTGAKPPTVAVAKKSIGNWSGCNGAPDDTDAVTRAFAAARNGAFTLVIDCPVRLRIGFDIARAIFIDNGTSVEFSGDGKLTLDNTLTPAFVVANSSNITLTDWVIEYDASLPVDPNSSTGGGHEDNGRFVAGHLPGGAFNSFRLTKWLNVNRGIVFDSSDGYSTARWAGPTNICAIFYFTGDTSNVTVTGMRVSIPATAGADRFVPVVFSFSPNFKSNQTVSTKTPYTSQYYAIPHDLTFSTIALDGTYMGWVGGVQNAVFDTIQSLRYGDLQDARGENVGGVGTWFAPPHLIYLSYLPVGDPALFNRNIQISNVTDHGVRLGRARDLGKSPLLGNALSLKIGCVDCSVNNYKSSRPDGFLDVLSSNGLVISNVTASYDSAFLNNLYPGWRFPKPPYTNVKFENISLTDTAATTVYLPIDNAYHDTNQDLQFKNVHVALNRWAGYGTQPFPTIAGNTNDVVLAYSIKANELTMTRSIQGAAETTIQATPMTLRAGGSTVLNWIAHNANSCSTLGAWSGDTGLGGTRQITFQQAGNYDFTVECRNGTSTSSATVRVVVGS